MTHVIHSKAVRPSADANTVYYTHHWCGLLCVLRMVKGHFAYKKKAHCSLVLWKCKARLFKNLTPAGRMCMDGCVQLCFSWKFKSQCSQHRSWCSCCRIPAFLLIKLSVFCRLLRQLTAVLSPLATAFAEISPGACLTLSCGAKH